MYIIIGLVLVAVAIVMNILVAIALSRGQRGYSRQRESRIYITNDKRDYCGMLFQIGAAIAEVAVCWIPIMVNSNVLYCCIIYRECVTHKSFDYKSNFYDFHIYFICRIKNVNF